MELVFHLFKCRIFSDLYSAFGGSTKSLDKDVGYDTKSSTSSDKKDSDSSHPYSFSSYLAMRTKSPARPPQSKSSTSSLQGSSSSLSSEPTRNGTMFKEEEEDISRPSYLSSKKEGTSKIGRSSLSSIGEGGSKPPRAPMRLKERSQSAKLPDVRDTSSEVSKPKTILSLKVSV